MMIVGRHRLDSSRQPGQNEHRLPRRHRRPALGGELIFKAELSIEFQKHLTHCFAIRHVRNGNKFENA
jgi:hypothetical protein